MGIITRLLHRSNGLTPNRFQAFLFDTGENIHLHYRDLRVEFSVDEFLEFHDLCLEYLPQLKAEIDGGYRDGVHPNTNQQSTWKQFWNRKPLAHPIRYHADRISLEENSDGYHVHIRNYKLLLDRTSFLALAGAAREALEKRERAVSVAEAIELIGINELPNRLEFHDATPGAEEAMVTVEPAWFRKACQVLAAVGFRREAVADAVHTYRKAGDTLHLRQGPVQGAGTPGIVPLADHLREAGSRLGAAELNLIKLQLLDTYARLARDGRLDVAEIRHDRLLYDRGTGTVVFPLRTQPGRDDPKRAFADFNRFLYGLGIRSLKPAKIPYPARQQERIQSAFEDHLRRFVAANPCVRTVYLFGGPGRGKPAGRYEVPYVHFDWAKLGSDFDLLIEIDENHVVPSGWEYKFFWEPAASGYYHLGDIDFPIESPYPARFPDLDFHQHMIEAYLFLPSKGDAARKDAFIEKMKGACIYRRDGEGGDLASRLAGFVAEAWGMQVAEPVSLAPPSFNEVYRLDDLAGGRRWVAKLMRRQDFTPAVEGQRGSHLEYEAGLLASLSAEGEAILLPIAGRDGKVLQELDDRFCALYAFVEVPQPGPDADRRIDLAATALARLHASAGAAGFSVRTHLFDTAAAYNLEQYATLLPRFKAPAGLGPVLAQLHAAGLAALGDVAAADLPRVHCHGDVCPANFFFLDDRAVLFDFQMAYHGPRLSDVAEGALEFARYGDSLDEARIARFVAAYERHVPLTPAERAALPAMLRVQALFRLARLFRLAVNFGYRISESRLRAFASFAAAGAA